MFLDFQRLLIRYISFSDSSFTAPRPLSPVSHDRRSSDGPEIILLDVDVATREHVTPVNSHASRSAYVSARLCQHPRASVICGESSLELSPSSCSGCRASSVIRTWDVSRASHLVEAWTQLQCYRPRELLALNVCQDVGPCGRHLQSSIDAVHC